jgi:hypothetical protein
MAGVYHRGAVFPVRGSGYAIRAFDFHTETSTVTANDFRRLALALPEAIESAHMDHPDFRVGGKIFATLGHPAVGWGMVKLHPEQQHYFSKAEPEVFVPVKGAWGRRGATSVNLKAAGKVSLAKALRAAWRNTAPKRLAGRVPEEL